jgi:hypothetical protein
MSEPTPKSSTRRARRSQTKPPSSLPPIACELSAKKDCNTRLRRTIDRSHTGLTRQLLGIAGRSSQPSANVFESQRRNWRSRSD